MSKAITLNQREVLAVKDEMTGDVFYLEGTSTNGALNVNATVTGGTGSSAVDDSPFAVGVDSGTPAMGLFDDVAPDSVNENDVGVLRMSGNRNAYTQIRDAAGNERGVNVTAGNALTVDGSGSTQPISGTVTANLGTLNGAATAANQVTGNSSLATIAGAVSGTEMQVDVLTMPTVTVTATNLDIRDLTFASDKVDASGSTLGANSGVDIGDVTVNNAAGAAAVNIQDGGNSITVDGTVSITANSSVNISQVAGATAQSGSGTATGALRVELPTNGTGVIATVGAVTAITNALPAGTNGIGKLTANSGVDIGDVDVTSAVSGTLDHGSNRDIDTSAEQITSTSFACKFGVTLRAALTNPGALWIGNSDVTANTTDATDGIPLYPGDSLFMPVTNSNIPYAIGSANNNIIYWFAV